MSSEKATLNSRHHDSSLLARPRPVVLSLFAFGVSLVTGAVGAVRAEYGIALVVAACLLGAVAIRPVVGAVLLAAVVPAISGLASGVPLRNLRISELLIGAVSVALIVLVRRRDQLAFDLLDWLLLGYGLAWALFGVVNALQLDEHLSFQSWGTVFGQLQFFLLYRGIRIGARSARSRRAVLRAVVAAASIVAVLAVAQEARFPGVGGLILHITGGVTQSGSAPTAGALLRATGPFDNWAALAGYLLPVILVMVALGLARCSVFSQRAALAVTALLTVAILTTVELSVLACLVVSVIWLGYRYRQGRQVATRVLGAVAAGGLVLSPLIWKRIASELAPTAGITRSALVPQTLAFRITVWTGQYLPAIGARLFEGYGVLLPPGILWPYTESQYVSLLIEGGIGLLVIFLGLSAGVILVCSRTAAVSTDPFDGALAAALLAVGVSLVAIDAIWPYFSNGGLPQVFWALLALVAPAWASKPQVAQQWARWPGIATSWSAE